MIKYDTISFNNPNDSQFNSSALTNHSTQIKIIYLSYNTSVKFMNNTKDYYCTS